MEGESLDLGRVKRLGAWARGTPGKRTFYLMAGDERTWVRMWVEKENLQMLADGVERGLIVIQRREAQPLPGRTQPDQPTKLVAQESREPSGRPAAEFKLGQMALGYDEEDGLFILLAHEAEANFQGPPTLQLKATPAQMQALSQRIREVCAGGRPVCPLCKGPIDPEGHMCVRSNGHQKWKEG